MEDLNNLIKVLTSNLSEINEKINNQQIANNPKEIIENRAINKGLDEEELEKFRKQFEYFEKMIKKLKEEIDTNGEINLNKFKKMNEVISRKITQEDLDIVKSTNLSR